MVEFSSVSASSYNPEALVTKLQEKAAEGWDVVSIVPTGGDVTAFLKRAGAGDAAPPGQPSVAESEAPPAWTSDGGRAADQATVEEPAGWAREPGPSTAVGAGAAGAAAEERLDQAGEAAEPSYGATGTEAPAMPEEPVVQIADRTPEPVTEPAPAPAVEAPPVAAPQPVVTTPAGWYPDPSGRFELRYWDGTQWTEHVARGGQQYTDPPVA